MAENDDACCLAMESLRGGARGCAHNWQRAEDQEACVAEDLRRRPKTVKTAPPTSSTPARPIIPPISTPVNAVPPGLLDVEVASTPTVSWIGSGRPDRVVVDNDELLVAGRIQGHTVKLAVKLPISASLSALRQPHRAVPA